MDKQKNTELSIVIPCFNEENAVSAVLKELALKLPEAEIIVIDDSSTDGSFIKLQEAASEFSNIKIYSHLFNRGYGASLKSGMEVATGKFVAWFDSDGEHKCDDLLDMYETIRHSQVAAIIAQRESRSATVVRGVGKWIIWLLAKSLGIDTAKDLNCGLRIFRNDIISCYLSILPKRYSASLTTTVLMSERDYPVIYHSIKTNNRIGESKVKIKDGFSSLIKVFQLVTLFAPLRLFFKPGFFLFIAGFVYGIIVSFVDGIGFPTAGVVLLLMGLLLCIFGLVSDQISQLRLEKRSPKGIVQQAALPNTDDVIQPKS